MPSVPSGFDLFRANVGDRLESEDYYLAFEVAAELADVFVVRVEKGGATRAGRASISSYLARAMPAMESKYLEMHGSDVGNDSLIWQSDAGERSNFAGMRHSHLDHGEIVFRLQSQQAKWQTEMIVEISFGAMDAVFASKANGRRLLWLSSCPSNR